MKAVFELREIQQDWNPPFQKKINSSELIVEENDFFDLDGNGKTKVFRLIELKGHKALIEYHRDYAPKGYVQPNNRQFWLEQTESKSFTSLWKNNGVTKTLKLIKVIE